MTRVSAVATANSGRPYSFTYSGFEGTELVYGFTPYLDYLPNVLLPGGERNGEDGSWWGKVDLRLEQEFGGIAEGHRTTGFIVIDNFTNLLNDEWGILREADFPQTSEIGTPAEARIGDASRYEIRLGVKYEF